MYKTYADIEAEQNLDLRRAADVHYLNRLLREAIVQPSLEQDTFVISSRVRRNPLQQRREFHPLG